MNKRSTILAFLTCGVVGALLALAYFILMNKPSSLNGDVVQRVVKPAGETEETTDPTIKTDNKRLLNPIVEESPEQLMARYGLTRAQDDPQLFAKALARMAESGNLEMLDFMKERNLITPEIATQIKEILAEGGKKLDPNNPVTEVGEMVRNKLVRWALNLDDGSRILVDLEKDDAGKWQIVRVVKPDQVKKDDRTTEAVDYADALSVIDSFMRATIKQDFTEAKKLVDPEKVADATIAGICILFEEGHYGLRKNQPLRNMFSNENKAGFLAYIQSNGASGANGAKPSEGTPDAGATPSPEAARASNIGITLEKKPSQEWIIADLALDSLLQDYALKFGDGDGLYVPMVKSPKGGDSLVLYFGFDESVLAPRSMRQLEIVAGILKVDEAKKIEISGHTDDLGTDTYNQALSEARAEAVKQALISAGLKPEQIITTGFGKKRQRKTIDGVAEDNLDTVRRANRRAEIYLDF